MTKGIEVFAKFFGEKSLEGEWYMKYNMYFFLGVLSFVGSVFSESGKKTDTLQIEDIIGIRSRLRVMTVENGTDSLEFKVFPEFKSTVGLVLPMSTLHIIDEDGTKGVKLSTRDPLMIVCTKGSYRPVFVQDGCRVSGETEEGYDGPYVASMWLPFPYISESAKVHVPYLVKKGEVGNVGIKIGSIGDYRLVALKNVKFLDLPEAVSFIDDDQDEDEE